MILEANTLFFRLAEIDDASFILGLRTDETYNKHLSVVDTSLAMQIDWLEQYKKREEISEEFYYIICLKGSKKPIGTVRIYDFKKDLNSFCWGSWILNENKTRYAAIECAILVYDFAFGYLNFNLCHMDIRKENRKVIDFHKRMGVKIIGETELNLLGLYKKEDYLQVRTSLQNLVSMNKL
jgi:RimJ/RimL family protein N-acetyltransferase